MIKKNDRNENLVIIIIFLLTLCAYITPFNSVPIMVDKELILKPLEQVESLSGYIELFKSGKLYDVQPIRDLSHLIDIWLVKATGLIQIPLIHNILILAATFIFLLNFLCIFFNRKMSLFLALIFLSHPATFNIYVEFTSRKHILSLLFFLISFTTFNREIMNKQKFFPKSYLWFGISILCHPINSFTFIANALFLKLQFKRSNTQIISSITPFAFLFGILVGFNLYYYNVLHVAKEDIVNLNHVFDPSLIIYGVALHFRSFFFPVYFSRFYEFFDIPNLLTILAIPVLYLSAIKKDKFITSISATITFAILFALYGHKSNILNVVYQNYYGLTTGISFLLLLGVIIKKSFGRHYYLILIPLIITSNYYGSIRSDKFQYLLSSVKIEPECRLIQAVLTIAVKKKDISAIQNHGEDFLNQKCRLVGNNLNNKHVYLNSMLIFVSNEFTKNQKIELFTKKFPSIEDQTFLLAGLELNESGKSKRFYELLLNLKNAKIHSIFLNNTYLGTDLIKACNKDQNQGCIIFNEYNKNFKDTDIYMKWNKEIKL